MLFCEPGFISALCFIAPLNVTTFRTSVDHSAFQQFQNNGSIAKDIPDGFLSTEEENNLEQTVIQKLGSSAYVDAIKANGYAYKISNLTGNKKQVNYCYYATGVVNKIIGIATIFGA